jgi:class 3 adenylate cyclase
VGIAVGHATLGRIGFEGRHDYGAIGNVTILASRLSSQAQAGQILLGPRISAILGGRAELESVGELRLKGLSRPVEAWNVVSLRSVPAAVELVPESA